MKSITDEQLRLEQENRRMRNALKILGIDPDKVIQDQKYDKEIYVGEYNG